MKKKVLKPLNRVGVFVSVVRLKGTVKKYVYRLGISTKIDVSTTAVKITKAAMFIQWEQTKPPKPKKPAFGLGGSITLLARCGKPENYPVITGTHVVHTCTHIRLRAVQLYTDARTHVRAHVCGWDGMGWDGMGRDGMGWAGVE